MKPRVLIALSSFGEYGNEPIEVLEKAKLEIVRNPTGRRLVREEIVKLGVAAHGIIAGVEPYDKEVLGQLPQLKTLSRVGVGLDNIDLTETKRRKIAVFNTPEVVVQPVAELTVAMIFDLLRKLTLQTIALKSGRWEKKSGYLLRGKTVGILGLGRIGRRVSEILKCLGCKIVASDIKPDKAWAKKFGVTIVPVAKLLKSADIVSIHLAHIDGKTFQLGAAEFKAMKKGAYLINTSRGQFIDEAALYQALEEGHLAGAALDVFAKEPYSGPLGELDNVVLTPHIATLTEESRLQMELEAAQNLTRFFRNSK